MNKTIILKFPWKTKDIYTGFKYHFRVTNMYIIMAIIARVLAICMLGIFVLKYVIPLKLELAAFIDIAFIILFLFPNKFLIYCSTYSYKKSHYQGKEIEWEISNDKIVSRMINMYETTMTWDMIQGVLDTPECFLLYPQQNMFYWLPKNAFDSEEDIAQFAYIAQDKVKNWQQVK